MAFDRFSNQMVCYLFDCFPMFFFYILEVLAICTHTENTNNLCKTSESQESEGRYLQFISNISVLFKHS